MRSCASWNTLPNLGCRTYPQDVSQEAVDFFHGYVGGTPPKIPSKTKLESFTEKVNPPAQGIVMLGSKLKKGEQEPSLKPAAQVRQVTPAAAVSQAEQELKALREQFRKLQAAQDRANAEKERLQRELEQKNAAKPAAPQPRNEKFQCPVCQDRDIEVLYSVCRHTFCTDCAEDWNERQKKISCPTCKQTSGKIEKIFIG